MIRTVVIGGGQLGCMLASELAARQGGRLSVALALRDARRVREFSDELRVEIRASNEASEIGSVRVHPLLRSAIQPGSAHPPFLPSTSSSHSNQRNANPIALVATPEIGDACDVAVFVTKHHDLEQAALELAKSGARPNALLSLANGWGGADELAKGWKRSQNEATPCVIASGVTYLGALALSPGSVAKTGIGKTILEDAPPVVEFCRVVGLPQWECVPNSEVLQIIWTKLFVNIVVNPLTALLDVPNGDIALPEHRPYVASVVNEFLEVSRASGRSLNLPPGKSPLDFVLDVCHATALNTSSMRADVLSRRRTEVDAVIRPVLNMVSSDNANHGLPLLRLLYALIKAKEKTSQKGFSVSSFL